MKIALIVEGKTEKAFVPVLRDFLRTRLETMPRLDTLPYDGRIPTREKLKRLVHNLLSGANAADYVIALTDVYTGSHPPDFQTADDAEFRMRQWVGEEKRFYPHAAQYDFEAWLLPYWQTIQRLAKHNSSCPQGNPECVNHSKPPSQHIKQIFELGKCRDSYVKPRDALRILRENDISVAVRQCSELRALVNTILTLCGGEEIQ